MGLHVLLWVKGGMNNGHHVEFAAEKQDSSAVVFEVTEATCVGLEGLNLGVEALGQCVGDLVLEVSQQTAEVSLE